MGVSPSHEARSACLLASHDRRRLIEVADCVQGLYKQLVEIFKSLGVEAVPGAGQPFDPEFHDAILREENNEVPNGTVLQELRRGFRLGKSLLRPSMVKVRPTILASSRVENVCDVENGQQWSLRIMPS